MSYVALYNKYRPQSFDDVVGQEVVVKTLQKMIESDRIANGYLFVGDRGLGKTTLAKIFSKAINCTGDGPVPCNNCPSCKSINSDSSFDLVELDAASNRGVDTVRDVIINKVQYKPRSRYKVYIIDECHMMTQEAWNALLKTLETPPPYVVFIFCTTNPEKVPKTIISRLQVYYLKNINNDDIVNRLKYICKQESFVASDDALYAIARYAKGGMRDSISALDQISAFTNNIQQNDVLSVLGMISEGDCFELFYSLLMCDYTAYANKISELIINNKDIIEAYNMISIMTRVAVNVSIGNTIAPNDLSGEMFERLSDFIVSKNIKYNNLIRLVEIIVDNEYNIKRSYDKTLVLLSIISKYMNGNKNADRGIKGNDSNNNLEEIYKRLDAIEKQLSHHSSESNIVNSIRDKLNNDDCDDEPDLSQARKLKQWFKATKKS